MTNHPRIDPTKGPGGGQSDAQIRAAAEQDLAKIFAHLQLPPGTKIENFPDGVRPAAQQILEDLVAMRSGKGRLTQKRIDEAAQKLLDAIKQDRVAQYQAPELPAGSDAHRRTHLPKDRGSIFSSNADGTIAVKGGLSADHALPTLLRSLGYDPSALPKDVAEQIYRQIDRPSFQLTSKTDYEALAKALAAGSINLGATSGPKQVKKAAQTTTSQPPPLASLPKVDHQKVATSTGPTRGNWLNTLTANKTSNGKDGVDPQAVKTAVDQFFAEVGIQNPSAEERKAAEELLTNVMKGATVNGEIKHGRLLTNSWEALSQAAGSRDYHLAALMAKRSEARIDDAVKQGNMPPEELARLNGQMLEMMPAVLLSALVAKTGRQVEYTPDLYEAMAGVFNATAAKVDMAGEPGLDQVGAVRRDPAYLFRSTERRMNALTNFAAKQPQLKELHPKLEEITKQLDAHNYPVAKDKLLDVAKDLDTRLAKLEEERKKTGKPPGEEEVLLNKVFRSVEHSLAGMQGLAMQDPLCGHVPAKDVRDAAKKAMAELMPGLDPKSAEGKRVMSALEQVFSKGHETDADVVKNATEYLSAQTGMDLGPRMQLLVAPYASAPNASAIARSMALQDVASYAMDPQGWKGQMQEHLQSSPMLSQRWDPTSAATGTQRSAVGFMILNDPSLSFEDKLFLFMMYMASFAEQDEMKKMEEIAELDRKEEQKQRRGAAASAALQKSTQDMSAAKSALESARKDVDRVGRTENPDQNAVKEAQGRLNAATEAFDRARKIEEAARNDHTRVKTEEGPTKSRDVLNMELRRLEQWRGMIMEMVKQIIEERNRRIRQIWQG
jgi:hypothetical protein